MGIHEVRRRQLQKLVDKFGSQTAVAELAGRQQDYLSRILSGKPAKEGGRNMGEKIARAMEGKIGLPHMYFDDPDAEPDGRAGGSLQEQLNALPPQQRREIEARFKEILELFLRREPEAAGPSKADSKEEMEPWRLTRDRDVSRKRRKRRK